MKSIILDTNAYTGLVNGNAKVLEYMAAADIVYISTVVLGELYAGFYGGNKFEWNSNILHELLEKEPIKIIDVSHNTSVIFGKLKNELKKKATMVPINDIWIAAHALETSSALVTFDKHFKDISGLTVLD